MLYVTTFNRAPRGVKSFSIIRTPSPGYVNIHQLAPSSALLQRYNGKGKITKEEFKDEFWYELVNNKEVIDAVNFVSKMLEKGDVALLCYVKEHREVVQELFKQLEID